MEKKNWKKYLARGAFVLALAVPSLILGGCGCTKKTEKESDQPATETTGDEVDL